MPARRSKRLGNIGLVALAVLAAGGVGFALFDSAPAVKPAPVSSQVQEYYNQNVELKTQPADTRPTVAFLGDSFTAGSGATGSAHRWTTLVAEKNQWNEVNVGFSGTNFATAGTVSGGTPYTDRVQKVVDAKPKIVFVSTAGNSMGTDQAAGVRQTFQALRAGLPDARIIATSPYYRAGEYPAVLSKFGATIKAEVEAVGGEYMDLGHPLGSHPEGVSQDNIHPNDAGYQLIADAVEARLKG